MTLGELVSYFRNGCSFKEFCLSQALKAESEAIEIYMQKPFSLNNNLKFFEIEITEGRMEYNFDGINYGNLFDFHYFIGAIEESNEQNNTSLTNDAIARRLHEYAINDA
ncbi:MAG: hypothetical protein EOP56_02160 [Sphingobacteriales bacterium]|nr:MAG: hypothetical protein EOP56_02160 [Sphingobacteriales bacterium]